MIGNAQNIAKQMGMLSRANKEHSTVAESLFQFLTGIDSGENEPKRQVGKVTAAAAGNGKKSPARGTRKPRR
jgi:hypothetical protein